ncbi:MAG: Gfo/Idh/MocA family oxidoreductase [Chloroflexi bacterium]|nr:Gfo/Idh/MocA family oxidoreductase [Chloroflexota bacterium]
MKPSRIGVVGPGLIWKNAHRPALEELGMPVELTAFSGSSERTRREVAETYPGVPCYSDYNELVESAEVDWVLVLTPIALNTPVAIAAMRAGKNVLLEKPMSRTLEEASELVRVADECGRQLYVLEQMAYSPALAAIRGVIDSGELGDLVMFDQTSHAILDATPEHHARGFGGTPWRIQPDFPLGTLFDGGHHTISFQSRLFGMPTHLFATGSSLRPTYGDYDHVLTTFEYSSNLRGVLSYSSYMGGERNYFYIRGTKGLLEVAGQRIIVQPYEGSAREVAVQAENLHVAMWRELLTAISNGTEPSYLKEMALGDMSILFAIDRSLKQEARERI